MLYFQLLYSLSIYYLLINSSWRDPLQPSFCRILVALLYLSFEAMVSIYGNLSVSIFDADFVSHYDHKKATPPDVLQPQPEPYSCQCIPYIRIGAHRTQQRSHDNGLPKTLLFGFFFDYILVPFYQLLIVSIWESYLYLRYPKP